MERQHEIVGKVPIVSITGGIASGKDTAGVILQEELGFLPLLTSDILREMVSSIGMSPPFKREDLSAFVWEQIRVHGNDFWIKHTLGVAARSLNGLSPKGITHIGTRIPADIFFLKKQQRTFTIWLEADEKVRLQRMKARGATPFQIEEFEDRDPKENAIMLPIKENVDLIIHNTGDMEQFRRDLVTSVRGRFSLDDSNVK